MKGLTALAVAGAATLAWPAAAGAHSIVRVNGAELFFIYSEST